MDAPVPPDTPAENMTPAQREARWTLRVWLAIEAPTEDEARDVLNQALGGLRMELRQRREPVIRPRRPGHPDDIWVAEVQPDLTHVQVIDTDDARTRCSFVRSHFPADATFMAPISTEQEARYEWPPGIWQKEPGQDDVLLHPALRAVTVTCAAKQD